MDKIVIIYKLVVKLLSAVPEFGGYKIPAIYKHLIKNELM